MIALYDGACALVIFHKYITATAFGEEGPCICSCLLSFVIVLLRRLSFDMIDCADLLLL